MLIFLTGGDAIGGRVSANEISENVKLIGRDS